ncbi:PTS sugar transporter subunit IIA [bacterium]|nr:PTS sugar transporter subunit IIA [bacterium]
MASTALAWGGGTDVRSPHVEDWALGFARVRRGLEWDSMDGQPVRLVFMLLANQRYALTFVKVISQIVRFVKDGQNRLALLESPRDQLVKVLKRLGT